MSVILLKLKENVRIKMRQNCDITMTFMTSCVGDVVLKTLKLALGYVLSTLVNTKFINRLS